MNSEKKYIGAFFDSNNNKDLTLWAGYDTATNHFCVSFCASHNDIFKQVLEASLFSYSAEYCAFDNGYWYSIFVDTPYKNNKNRESKTSTNEIDYSSLENDIADILKKIDPEVKKSKEQKMSSDKNANDNNNDNNKKKTIRYWPLIVFGIIILIPLLLIILARANFTLKIKGTEFSYTLIDENSYLPIICILAMVGFLFCIGIFYIVSYKILKQEEKLELIKEIFTKEGLNSISKDETITKKNENPLNPAIVTETIESHKYDSKSKVLISAIEAIREL